MILNACKNHTEHAAINNKLSEASLKLTLIWQWHL